MINHQRITRRAFSRSSKGLGLIGGRFVARRLKNPVFVVGCHRSGTGLLRELLGSHQEVALYPGEANELWHPRAHTWHERTIEVSPWWEDPWAYHKDSWAARTERDDTFIRASFAACQMLHGGRIFLNKSPLIAFLVDEIGRLFPGCKFIHIVRDGRPVSLSLATKLFRRFNENRRAREAYSQAGYDLAMEEWIRLSARYWNELIHAVDLQVQTSNLRTEERFIEIRYEDLCLHPDESLSRLASFMDVEPTFDRSLVENIVNRNDKVSQMSSDLLSSITEIMDPGLKIKGYPQRWLGT